MTWFKVDDSFHSHPKVLAADASALGLWVIAGAWCSANLTDGFVPDHVLPRILPDSAALADALVACGLWGRVKGGYRFHDWHDYQPTAEDVQDERKAARERMRNLRARRRANQEIPGQRLNGSGEHAANVRAEFAEVPDPDPTRPDHLPSEALFSPPHEAANTKPSKPAKRPTERGTRIPDDFGISEEMRQWAAEEIPKFDIDREFPKFRDYWRSQPGQRGVRKEWPAVFRNWMRRASEQNARAAYPDNRSHNGANGIALRDQQPRQSTGTQRMQQALDVAAQLDEQFANGGNS